MVPHPMPLCQHTRAHAHTTHGGENHVAETELTAVGSVGLLSVCCSTVSVTESASVAHSP